MLYNCPFFLNPRLVQTDRSCMQHKSLTTNIKSMTNLMPNNKPQTTVLHRPKQYTQQ